MNKLQDAIIDNTEYFWLLGNIFYFNAKYNFVTSLETSEYTL